MLAGDLLALVRATVPKVTGIRVVDPFDVDSWSFDGLITPEERAAAVSVVQLALTPPAVPVSKFFPVLPTKLEQDVAALKRAVGVA